MSDWSITRNFNGDILLSRGNATILVKSYEIDGVVEQLGKRRCYYDNEIFCGREQRVGTNFCEECPIYVSHHEEPWVPEVGDEFHRGDDPTTCMRVSAPASDGLISVVDLDGEFCGRVSLILSTFKFTKVE